MKTYIKSTFLALGAVAILAGCNENDWNDHLDGFTIPEPGSNATALTYTLTDADYVKIAGNDPYKSYAQGLDAAAENDDATAALKLVGSTHSFGSSEQAVEYLKLFLGDSSNNFFSLANGSSVKLTYNVATAVPEIIKDLTYTQSYTLTERDYKEAWGSEDDFIAAFAPSVKASAKVPDLLIDALPDAESGDYVVVTYNEATQDPIFQTVSGGDEPEVPAYELTSALQGVAVGDNVDVKGVVTAVDKRGFVLTDNAGSILCYQNSGFDVNSVAVGNYVSLSAQVSAYGTGLQIAISDGSYTIEGMGEYTYPTPTEYTGAMIDEAVTRTDNALCEYVSFVGTAVKSGSYLNFNVDGATASQGSGYQVPDELFASINDNQAYRVNGYFCSVSSGKYFNVVITSVTAVDASSARHRAPVVAVPSTPKNELYKFNGTKWSLVKDVTVLQPSDYTAMGQSYGNLSGTLPSELLPIYLKNKYPYAAADDVVTLLYVYYAGGASSWQAAQYTYNGIEWASTIYAETVTSQFVKRNGNWVFDPSVVITLPYVRNADPSYTFYMACVEWVYENIGKEMGGTSLKSSPFIDYRGNAEFYSGASAYYGNVDVRAVTAKNNAPEGYTGYDGLTDEEIVLLVEKRFCLETLPGALAMLYPDATAIEGMEVTYTINFTAYETGGVATERTIVYTVEGPAQFKYKSCTWFENGEDAEW